VCGERSRPDRARSERPSGRHLLRRHVAAELARDFRVRNTELVVEAGAGTGRLTRELARSGALILAVELDGDLARRLLRSTGSLPNVYVQAGDGLEAALPSTPFRVVGNIPFGITTRLLRRIVDAPNASRLDLITQLEPARKRAAARGNVLSVLWATTWRLGVRRRVPARSFDPAPSVDAAWLSGHRRGEPLIQPPSRAAFERMVREAFRDAGMPIERSLALPRRVVADTGVDPRRRAVDLTVEEWVRLFRRIVR
jgi:23S rRNA (adenine-N6)-dimethyltransferase